MLAVAGCQSGNTTGAGAGASATAQAGGEGQVRESELRAYCPRLMLREGTAYYNSYQRGGEQDPTKVIYQAAITDVTRKCSYTANGATMTVAAAGKIVPGPLGSAGSITMPIRVAVVRGDQVLDSRLHQYTVQVTDTSGATQFIFNDPNVLIPTPVDGSVQVFVGFDEGPNGGQ